MIARVAIAAALLAAAPGPGEEAPAEKADPIERLRHDCYGGRSARQATEMERQLRLHQASERLLARDAVGAAKATRRLLRGGGDEGRLLPGLIKALEAANDAEGAAACAALLRSLPRVEADAAAEGSTGE